MFEVSQDFHKQSSPWTHSRAAGWLLSAWSIYIVSSTVQSYIMFVHCDCCLTVGTVVLRIHRLMFPNILLWQKIRQNFMGFFSFTATEVLASTNSYSPRHFACNLKLSTNCKCLISIFWQIISPMVCCYTNIRDCVQLTAQIMSVFVR